MNIFIEYIVSNRNVCNARKNRHIFVSVKIEKLYEHFDVRCHFFIFNKKFTLDNP